MTNLCFYILDGDYNVMKLIPTRLMRLLYFLQFYQNCNNFSSI